MHSQCGKNERLRLLLPSIEKVEDKLEWRELDCGGKRMHKERFSKKRDSNPALYNQGIGR